MTDPNTLVLEVTPATPVRVEVSPGLNPVISLLAPESSALIEVIAPGPQGPEGPQGPSGPAGSSVSQMDVVAGSSGEQVITLPVSPSSVQVSINGLQQVRAAFSLSGDTVTIVAEAEVETGDGITIDYS